MQNYGIPQSEPVTAYDISAEAGPSGRGDRRPVFGQDNEQQPNSYEADYDEAVAPVQDYGLPLAGALRSYDSNEVTDDRFSALAPTGTVLPTRAYFIPREEDELPTGFGQSEYDSNSLENNEIDPQIKFGVPVQFESVEVSSPNSLEAVQPATNYGLPLGEPVNKLPI